MPPGSGTYPAYVNQYETQTFIDSVCPEPATGSVCCSRPDGNNTLFQLYKNDTPYILYQVTYDEPTVRQFELSIKAANKSTGEAIAISIEPWQSYPQVASALDASTKIAGSVELSNIGKDVYTAFKIVDFGDYGSLYRFNVLTQSSLDEEGDHETSANEAC